MNKWIPVTERLPKETGRYLVTYHEWSRGDYLPKYNDSNVRVMKCVSTGNCGFTHSKVKFVWQFPRNLDPKAEKDVNREVIAWMPLPAPYKDGEQK